MADHSRHIRKETVNRRHKLPKEDTSKDNNLFYSLLKENSFEYLETFVIENHFEYLETFVIENHFEYLETSVIENLIS